MRKEPILMKKLAGERIQGKLIIGVIGTHSGAGVTHLGILLANYLSQYMGQKTAFLECGPKNELQYLEQYFFEEPEDSFKQDSFTIRRVTFYKNKSLQGIPEIVGDSFDCIILDLGTDMAKNKYEFLRCDIKIVVSSLAVWKKQELERFAANTTHIKNNEQWAYVIPFAQNKVLKEAAKKLQRKIYRMPYEPDPFVLSADAIYFFRRLIR